ncbi:hypothetical protein LI328DRAFT_129789 [Trichoderma asperelloides]|nr:hypothetical protein LI328DRAFT_129789 [Trichoderma asperelloides]
MERQWLQRVMRRTKEQSGDQLGGSSLIALDQSREDRGNVFSKARRRAKNTSWSATRARRHKPGR